MINMFGTDVNDELVDKYRPLVAEVFKLLAEMSIDARAHGSDVSPYFQRLFKLNASNGSNASGTFTIPAKNH